MKEKIKGEIKIYSIYKEAVESVGGSKAGVRKAVNRGGIYKGRWEIKKDIDSYKTIDSRNAKENTGLSGCISGME